MAQTCVVPLRPVRPVLLNRGAVALALIAALIGPAGAWGARSASASSPVAGAQNILALACDSSKSTPVPCDLASLRAIDVARSGEGLPPLALPADYEHLSMVDQIVAVTNAERVPRRLPAWYGPNQALGRLAGKGVVARQDPAGPAGMTWASNLATGVLTVLEADYEWMYDDGPGGTNPACTAAHPAQCWAHRANILSPWAGMIGAAGQTTRGRLVLAEVMVERQVTAAPPALSPRRTAAPGH
jgi:hypothetical protein